MTLLETKYAKDLNGIIENPSVSLVLGSGGARGLAHIGIIKTLEQNNFTIKSISGCSIGALVGGIYAAGSLDTFEEWVRAITKIDIIRFMDVSWGDDGIVKGDKIINTLVELVGEKNIEDLPIKFTAVAADIKNDREIWINSGSLFSAIRASISLPLFLKPAPFKNTYLVDGGVLNPVPIAPTFHDNTDLTIAVNLGGAPMHDDELNKGDNSALPFNHPQLIALHQKIQQFWSFLTKEKDPVIKSNQKLSDIAIQAFDSMQNTIARQKLAAYPPDHLIEIPRNASRTLEFFKAEEMIRLGEEAAKEFLKDYHNEIEKQNKKKNKNINDEIQQEESN